MGTIANGKDTPLNLRQGTIPDVSGALKDWYQTMVFEKVIKSVVAFQAVESGTPITFQGTFMPLTERQLMLKPEGQRAWSWFLVYAEPQLTLQVDDVVIWNGKQTRVMGRTDYGLYGYVQYSLVQDWTGSGP